MDTGGQAGNGGQTGKGWHLSKIRLQGGHWLGLLQGGSGAPPELAAEHLGRPLPAPQLTPAGSGWQVDLALPVDVLSDGAHCVVIRRADDLQEMALITFIAGEDLAPDLRAEMAQLRAELDLVKRALRALALRDAPAAEG